MMKRLIVAVLPILLAAQIPLSVTKYVPSDLKKNFDFGVKWTELLLESYSSDSNRESESDSIPEGFVTTTVVLASMHIPDIQIEDHLQIVVGQEMCQLQAQVAKSAEKAIKIQQEFNKKYRMTQIKTRIRTIQL